MDNVLTADEVSCLWNLLDKVGAHLHGRLIKGEITSKRMTKYDDVFGILEQDYGYQRERCKQVANEQS